MLKPQQNIVAVVVDDSRSMALSEDGTRRIDSAKRMLDGGLLEGLKGKFLVKVYRLAPKLEPVAGTQALAAAATATRLGDGLKQAVGEAATLPVGAIVLLSDGAENAGGVDLETTAEIRRQGIPIHAVGFGRETMTRDIEMSDAVLPARALQGARLSAAVTYRQQGFDGQKTMLRVYDGDKPVATREITLRAGGVGVTETVVFNAGTPGAKAFRVALEGAPGEENARNNSIQRLVNVQDRKPRILYFEGEPRWEFKFIRRAIEADPSLELVSILRTTQNKIYRQGIANAKELEDGFPAEVKELFGYDGIVMGSVEAAALTPAQLNLLREFVDRRGGGLLLLGGRAGLSEGGWQKSPLAELLPVTLPDRKGTFRREPANVELTQGGRDSLLTRIEDNLDTNASKWRAMPQLADYQEVGLPKPGAISLIEMLPVVKNRLPLLVVQNYGRGRTGVFATGGSWRWQMLQDSRDQSHEVFWQQLLRWLVSETRGPVVGSTPRPLLADETTASLRAEVRDSNFAPLAGAKVEASIIGPENASDRVTFEPDPVQPGVYTAKWETPKAGAYLAEITAQDGESEAGRDVVVLRREDGVAEDFRTEQNRPLLEKLAGQTGGRYFKPDQTRALLDAVALSDAGITVRETRDLWNMPGALLLLAGLKTAEWLLRRKWGAV
jgi:uncharacterized membrane protein